MPETETPTTNATAEQTQEGQPQKTRRIRPFSEIKAEAEKEEAAALNIPASEPARQENAPQQPQQPVQVVEPTNTSNPAPIETQPGSLTEPLSDDQLLRAENNSTAYNPLQGERVQRDYSNTQQSEIKSVEEPKINVQRPQPPPQHTPASQPASVTGQPQPQQPTPQVNPALNQVSEEEKRLAAQQFTDMVLGGYEELWALAAYLLKVDDDTLKMWIMKKKISATMSLPIGMDGEDITVQEYFQFFNKGVEEGLLVDPKKMAAVREPMIRECMKRGVGLSDLQFIAQFFMRDLAQRSGATFVLYKQQKTLTEMLFSTYKQQQQILEHAMKGRTAPPAHEDESDPVHNEAQPVAQTTEPAAETTATTPK